jgi:hypothetical protein
MVQFAILIINNISINSIKKMSTVEENTLKCSFRNFDEFLVKRFYRKDRSEWFKDMKANISLTASIIATMTFALATNPPGGVVQADVNLVGNHYCKSVNITNNHDGNITRLCVGQAVLGSISFYEVDYFEFVLWDTICFFAAITVIFMLVSGIPLEHTITISILSLSIGLTLASLGMTFVFASKLITPNTIWKSYGNALFFVPVVYMAMLFIVYMFHVLVFWRSESPVKGTVNNATTKIDI